MSKSEESAIFHHYYIGSHKTIGKTNLGVSTDYSRDVFPSTTSTNSFVKPNIDRFKFHGFSNTTWNNSSNLFLSLNYTPQIFETLENFSTINNNSQRLNTKDRNLRSNILSANMSYTKTLGSNIENLTKVGYNSFDTKSYLSDKNEFSNSSSTFSRIENEKTKNTSYFINNTLSYHFKQNQFYFEPSISLNYRYETDENLFESSLFTSNQLGLFQTSKENYNLSQLNIIPILNFYYGKFLNLSLGIDANKIASARTPNDLFTNRYQPFIHLGYDLSSLWTKELKHVMLYSSYMESSAFLMNNQADYFNYRKLPGFLTDIYNDNYLNRFGGSNININSALVNNFDDFSITKDFQSGISIPAFKNKLYLNYNFGLRNLDVNLLSPLINPNGQTFITQTKNADIITHSLALNFNTPLIKNGFLKSALTVKLSDINYKDGEPNINSINLNIANWDRNSQQITLGFINRILMKNFIFEGDLIAHFKQNISSSQFNSNLENYNSLNIQNLSLGYKLNTSKLKNFEIFFNMRNAYYNEKSNLTDGRKYYGLGFKTSY